MRYRTEHYFSRAHSCRSLHAALQSRRVLLFVPCVRAPPFPLIAYLGNRPHDPNRGRFFAIALRARDSFAMLLAVAMTALLTVPALLNAAVVMGVVPTKGLTLPFLSYGRTSLVVSFLAVGILLGIGRREGRAPAPKVARAERRRSWTR